jgi:hypothetical protein
MTADASELSPASCGYIPEDGWPHKWARDGHRDACDECSNVEALRSALRYSLTRRHPERLVTD